MNPIITCLTALLQNGINHAGNASIDDVASKAMMSTMVFTAKDGFPAPKVFAVDFAASARSAAVLASQGLGEEFLTVLAEGKKESLCFYHNCATYTLIANQEKNEMCLAMHKPWLDAMDDLPREAAEAMVLLDLIARVAGKNYGKLVLFVSHLKLKLSDTEKVSALLASPDAHVAGDLVVTGPMATLHTLSAEERRNLLAKFIEDPEEYMHLKWPEVTPV